MRTFLSRPKGPKDKSHSGHFSRRWNDECRKKQAGENPLGGLVKKERTSTPTSLSQWMLFNFCKRSNLGKRLLVISRRLFRFVSTGRKKLLITTFADIKLFEQNTWQYKRRYGNCCCKKWHQLDLNRLVFVVFSTSCKISFLSFVFNERIIEKSFINID